MFTVILNQIKYQLLLLSFLIVVGCNFVKVKDEAKLEADLPKPVARVNDTYLHRADLEGMVSPEVSPTDSADRISAYINQWIRKQLLIDEATSRIDFDEAEIQRKILDYRYSLIAYGYQEYYINQHLNKEVSDQEIKEYYEQNADNFPLKQNIIRGKFIKVPNDAPKTGRIRKLMYSKKAEEIEELKSYCFSYATNYSLEDSIWINFDDIIKNTPLVEIPNRVQFLTTRKFVESSDSTSKYFLKIDEYKKTDDTAPLEIVKDQIINIIINKRKVELADNLEKEVYDKAIETNAFEIYK
jgi:hypothetical protein